MSDFRTDKCPEMSQLHFIETYVSERGSFASNKSNRHEGTKGKGEKTKM